MKPLKLTMSAFGSYAGVQEVDFAELGDAGLYLITGETGSGKTTIFDAISFALFGKASGTARDDYSMLRSDFAASNAKTYVELDFASGENQYNIKRTIKKTGQDAALILPDGTSVSGDRNIKLKIAEIIGLDRDQFAQIVMIAQNDFLRFLQSGTDERLKILRRIFGTEAFKQFQERLKSLVKRESEKRALILHDFERHEVDVYKRNEKFAQWELLIKSDKAELLLTDEKLSEADKRKQTLAAALAVAEELFKKFTDLAKRRNELDAHKAKSDEAEEMKTRSVRGEISLRRVKPLADEAQKAAANHMTAKTGLISAQKNNAAAAVELEKAAQYMQSLPPLAQAQDAYAVLSKEWETAEQKLKHLLDLQKNRNEIVDKHVVLNQKKKELTAVQEALDSLPPINEYQAEFERISTELNINGDRLNKLSALKNDFEVVVNKQAELTKEQSGFKALNAQFADIEEKYRILEEAFLRSQAGIIAGSLVDGEACPVCGSTEHPAPAKLSGGDISETTLKMVKEAKDKAGARREIKSSACGALKAETETLEKRLIADLSLLIPGITMETAGALLEKNTYGIQSVIEELKNKKNLAEGSLTGLKDNLEKSTERRDGLIPVIASLQSEIDALAKRFIADFSAYIPNIIWESSEAELAGLFSQTKKTADELTLRKKTDKQSLDTLVSNWASATKRKTDAESAAGSAATLVKERAANEQKLLQLQGETRSSYMTALRENNFSDDEYKAALLTENELATLKNFILDYNKRGEQLAHDITRLESETAGREQPDIIQLQSESEGVNSEYKLLIERRDEINRRLGKTENAFTELLRAAADFEKVEKTYAAVKQLADTANGKIDFETYAQMAYFERVLRAANLRLKVMSQNRYALLRKTESNDGRRRSGLEIEVLDSYTGKARSANSLSGGESFIASLSLALGLSDVVGQNAGGVRLDAMFIDEGFGSLDVDAMELAIRTLSEMAGANRIIGIISHITELRERIDKQIQVEKTPAGSIIYSAVVSQNRDTFIS